MSRYLLALSILWLSSLCPLGRSIGAAEPFWLETPTGTSAGLRAVAVAKHSTEEATQVVWASGAKGTVVTTSDRGRTWRNCGPREFQTLEFRSIHAWSEKRAIIASAGTPALILITDDAGESWQEVHRNDNPKSFLDGMRFLDQRQGVVFGDPIEGRFEVLRTLDGGRRWTTIERGRMPEIRPDETAFAASNSALAFDSHGGLWIATGGTVADKSRLYSSRDFGESWQVVDCPLASGPTFGAFSVASANKEPGTLVVVGGDFRLEAVSKTKAAVSHDRGQTFQLAVKQPRAFRSAVCYTPGGGRIDAGFYATGPIGTDYSPDGNVWNGLNDIGFHAMAALPSGGLVAVGAGGRCGWAE